MITEVKEKNKAKRTNFHLVAIDNTKYWRDDIQKACGKITTVYYYDKGQHTYCCELTPSYYLIPLYAFAENEISDEVYDDLMLGIASEDPGYEHVSSVDKRKSVKAPASLNGVYYASEGKKYRELCEAAEEYLNGNHLI